MALCPHKNFFSSLKCDCYSEKGSLYVFNWMQPNEETYVQTSDDKKNPKWEKLIDNSCHKNISTITHE